MSAIPLHKTVFEIGARNKFQRRWLVPSLGAILIAVYIIAIRPTLLATKTIVNLDLYLMAGLVILLVVGLFILVLTGLFALIVATWTRTKSRIAPWLLRLRRILFAWLILLAAILITVLSTQLLAYTPPILGADNRPLPGSIASIEKIQLGGVDQWLVIRGKSTENPVLLFLSGGPGGSELARVRNFNTPLEDRFTLVVWEQRGCGKSYPAIAAKSGLTVEQYVADAIELSEILRARFAAEKIYLMGHSWGSIIGVLAAQQRPDLYHAYIGSGQMVDVLETDQTIYQMVLDQAQKTGDTSLADRLTALGVPPYGGNNPVMNYTKVFGPEFDLFEKPNIKSEKYKQEGSSIPSLAFIPEYGWIDRVGFMLGAMNTFNAVYPQLQDLDFRVDVPRLDVPVYFLLGRHDVNATSWVAEEYFNQLQAPLKRLYWFEDSGHGMIWQEPDKFHDIMINTILPET